MVFFLLKKNTKLKGIHTIHSLIDVRLKAFSSLGKKFHSGQCVFLLIKRSLRPVIVKFYPRTTRILQSYIY